MRTAPGLCIWDASGLQHLWGCGNPRTNTRKRGKVAWNSIPGCSTACKSSKQWSVCRGRTGSQLKGCDLIQSGHDLLFLWEQHRGMWLMSDLLRDTFCWHLQAELEALASLSWQAVALPRSPYTCHSEQGHQKWLFWSEAGVWKLPSYQVGYSRALFYPYKLIPW